MKLGLEFNHAGWSSPAGLTNAPTVARGRGSLGNASGALDAVLLRATEVFTPHMLNQLRLSYVRDVQFETPQPNLPQEPGIGPSGMAPEVNIAPNGLQFGTPASVSRLAFPLEQRIEVDDTFTVTRGRHLLELGGDLTSVKDHVATLANAAGTFSYDSGTTRGFAGGLVDYITDATFNVNQLPNGGCPAISATVHNFCFRSYTQSFGASSASFPMRNFAAFAEDTWRLRTGLTLRAGVRYEYTLLPLPATPNAALDAVFGARGATSVFPEDRNNFGPRVSLAWQPGAWSVHLGGGLFYGRLAGATVLAALSNTSQPGSTAKIRIRPTDESVCPQQPANGFGFPCSFLNVPGGVAAQTTSAMVFDRHFRLPAVTQGSLTLGRRLGRAGGVSAGYVFNLDRQLPSSTDLNIAPASERATLQLKGGTGAVGVRDGEIFTVPLYTSRLSPAFGPVTVIESNANASYHSLVLAATAQPAASLRLAANGVWSKAIDSGPSLSATPRTNNQFDPYTDGYDKGLSSLNYPFSWHGSAVWSPGFAAAAPAAWLRRVGSRWQVTPVVAAHSGRPYTLDLSGGTHLQGGHNSVNGSGGALYLPTVGRNTLRLPTFVEANLRLARAVELGPPERRLRLNAWAEVFNLLNHQNVSSVTQRAYLVGTPVNGVTPLVFQDAANIAAEGLNTQPFGTRTASSTSLARERQVQLGVRLEF